jgi:hypothetical protein
MITPRTELSSRMSRALRSLLATVVIVPAATLLGCSSDAEAPAPPPPEQTDVGTVSSSLVEAESGGAGVCSSGQIFCGCVRECYGLTNCVCACPIIDPCGGSVFIPKSASAY